MTVNHFWSGPLGDAVHTLANSLQPPADHECRDCPKNGGIGFDCHHLVRGRHLADGCQWCQAHGLKVGQEIPRQNPPGA
jgi:hypothetical protein